MLYVPTYTLSTREYLAARYNVQLLAASIEGPIRSGEQDKYQPIRSKHELPPPFV
jgi:hypothetical protein